MAFKYQADTNTSGRKAGGTYSAPNGMSVSRLRWLTQGNKDQTQRQGEKLGNQARLKYLRNEKQAAEPQQEEIKYQEEQRRQAQRVYPSWYTRSGYASPTSMTENEWRARRLAWSRYYGATGMTEQERILRQNVAPVGYTYTPYAGWVPNQTNMSSLFNAIGRVGGYMGQVASNTYSQQQGGGGYYDYGGGGGGGGYSYTPDYYNNLMTWKIK